MRPNMKTGIYFDGRWYTPDGKGYYYNSHTRKRLHQAIWISHNGPIPKDCEIHHKDFDKSNNDISNLICLTKAEHRKLHSDSLTDEQREWYRQNLDKNARPRASEWHKSEAGLTWHREHIRKQIENGSLNKKVMFKCSMCGKEFESVARNIGANHFCGNNCKAKFLRRKRSQDKSDTRICIICGKEYNCSRWSSTQTCSKSCAMALRAQNMKEKNYAIQRND